MAKSGYIGVDGIARKMTAGYIGVDGIARKVKKAYIGDTDGKARLCWDVSSPWVADGAISSKETYYSICYGDGKFVATSAAGALYYSKDGVTYSFADRDGSSTGSTPVTSVCYNYDVGAFVAVTRGTARARRSEDGITWGGASLDGTREWSSVACGNGKFVAIALNSNISAYSTNGGYKWVNTKIESGNWISTCFGNGKFVSIQSSGTTYMYSSDGITWTNAQLPFSTNWCSICFGGNKFIAVGKGASAIYSTDGINWSETTMPANTTWRSVCYGNGQFVAVGDDGCSAYSTDGINWTQTTMPTAQIWVSVCYGEHNGRFVAIDTNGNSAYWEVARKPKYSITNIVADFNEWGLNENASVSNNIITFTSGSGITAMTTYSPSIKPIAGHIYYGRVLVKSDSTDFSCSDGRFEWYNADATNKLMAFSNAYYDTIGTDWAIQASFQSISEQPDSSENWYIRNFIVNGTTTYYRKEPVIIDLTAGFGEGNEPDLEWCNTNIPFFTGTIDIIKY